MLAEEVCSSILFPLVCSLLDEARILGAVSLLHKAEADELPEMVSAAVTNSLKCVPYED